MASAISSWITSTIRHLNPFPTQEQNIPTAFERYHNQLPPTPDPIPASRHILLPQTPSHSSTSPAPEISPDVHIIPEHSCTPQPEPQSAPRSVSRGVNNRLDLAVQAALNRSGAPLTHPISRLSNLQNIEEDSGDEIEAQVREQIQMEVLKSAVAEIGSSGQGFSRATSVYESDTDSADGHKDDASSVTKPTYSFSWCVDDSGRIRRAALVMASSEDPETAPAVVRSAAARPLRPSAENSAVKPEVVDQAPTSLLLKPAAETSKLKTPVQKMVSSQSNPVDLTATPPPADSNIFKKRKVAPAPALVKSAVKKLKRNPKIVAGSVTKPKTAPKARPAPVVMSGAVPEVAARPARHAAKMANKATKSALWREALHDDTFLKRAEHGGNKQKGKRS